MPEHESNNPFQDWLASSEKFLGGRELPPELSEKCAALFGAWQRLTEVLAEGCGAASNSGGNSGGPFDPAGWADLAGGGGLGDLWDWFGGARSKDAQPRRRVLENSREWVAYGAALTKYRGVLGTAWLAAFTRFADEMTSAAPVDLPAMQACWQRVADAEMAVAQRSQTYLDAQQELIRARLDCAAALRAQADHLAQLLGLPTRAEVDAMHATVHELQQKLRRRER